MRHRGRIDSNQPAIVEALRDAGADVCSLTSLGNGIPDLLVSYRDTLYLLEVKGEKGRLTPQESAWHSAWRGRIAIVHSVDEALKAIGAT